MKKIEKVVVDSYKKIEDSVVDGYQKIEDKFVDTFLKKDGESTEDAKSRIKEEQIKLEEENKSRVEQSLKKSEEISKNMVIINGGKNEKGNIITNNFRNYWWISICDWNVYVFNS